MEEFIGNKFLQKCGDELFVLEETNQRAPYGAKLFRCQFQKYPCEVLVPKSDIKRGNISNPQIEKIEFWDKIHIQNNGDKIKVINKTEKKKGKYILYECKSLIYKNTLLLTRTEILGSQIVNPQIEINKFVSKLWPQHCGDTLKIIKKTDKKTSDITDHYLWECKFQKYPCIVYAEKGNIIKGKINNPKIIEIEFESKKWPQNCGGNLIIFEKHYGGYYKCKFEGYAKEYLELKEIIKAGRVVNKELPWFSKEQLEKYIKEKYKDQKPTYSELAKDLQLSNSHINNKILEFGLQHLIHYSVEGSQVERDIKDYIQSLLPNEQISNTWTELENGQEIDIFVPNLRLGIEYNGNYWHCNKEKEPNYHQDKTIQALSRGIYLMHIFEYEWQSKEEICKSLIKSRLEIFNKKIGARSCKIKELSNKEYQDFCENNHLQGQAGAKIKLGLIYKDELVQIMSFGCPRFTDKYEWEIIRECSKLGYFIIGGKNKLWNYFVKKYSPKNCLSYCDFSKFNGKSYLRLGFKQISLNKPGFVWYDEKTNQTLWRNPSKHQEYKDKYLKIYDCGQLVFIWNNN